MIIKKAYEYDPIYQIATDAIRTVAKELFYEATEEVQFYCYIYPVAIANVRFRRLGGDYQYNQPFDSLSEKYRHIADHFFVLYALMVNEYLVPSWNKALVSIRWDGDINFQYKFDHELSLFEVDNCFEAQHKKHCDDRNQSIFQWE